MSMRRSYTETYDMNTEKDTPCLLGIHSPIGQQVRAFLDPCFRLYKKYRYLGCDVTIVNSARLPVDPEQVGRIEGTNYVDPRDTLNPVLFRGCHGESLGKVLDSMYGGLASDIFKKPSLDKVQLRAILENFYYTALGDDSWRKSPIQKTLNIRGLHPLVYGLATQHQIMPTNRLDSVEYSMNNPISATPGAGNVNVENGVVGTPGANSGYPFLNGITAVYDPTTGTYTNSITVNTMFTNKTQRLGWMDTLQFVGNLNTTTSGFDSAQVAQLPKIFMGLLMLPPAYLCRQYLRVIIRHKFAFAGYRTITTGGASYPDVNFETTENAWGYTNEITGNVPESSSKNVVLSGPAAVSDDGFTEVEPDESE